MHYRLLPLVAPVGCATRVPVLLASCASLHRLPRPPRQLGQQYLLHLGSRSVAQYELPVRVS
jgi:hypothetical protein